MIFPFTAPKILTRLNSADIPMEKQCGDWSNSIPDDLVKTTAHKQSRDLLTMQLRGQTIMAYSKQANKYSGYMLEFIKLFKVLYWSCKNGMCV